jgi:catechol 2,3-dioxygenase-like lactoylglutathione lyase family enzyme
MDQIVVPGNCRTLCREGVSMSLTHPAKVAHVVYRTRRFKDMVDWYPTVFGARVQYEDPALAFLTFDDENHRFTLLNMETFQPKGSVEDRQGAIGLDHVGFSYGSLSDLLEN